MKYIKCIINIINLNFLLFYTSKFKKKKTIVFYHPNYNLVSIHTKFIESLLRNNDYYCIYLHQNDQIKKKKYYFLINYFCKLIFNSDYFISNNVCDYFTPFSKRIYIHHDIYDTPLVDNSYQEKLRNRLKYYTHIFLASKNTKLIFENLFKKLNKKPKLIVIGYYKLDYLLKNQKKVRKDSIIIAPTNYLSFKNLSLYNFLKQIIKNLLKNTSLNIIFRPHPSNLNSFKVKEINNLFKKNKKFKLDKSIDYSKVYNSSLCLITDISGTAYTYAFLTKRPVIFFREYKKSLEKKYEKLNYFRDRRKIGVIFNKTKNFNTIKKIFENKNFYKKNINKLIKNNLDIGNSKMNFFNEIKKL